MKLSLQLRPAREWSRAKRSVSSSWEVPGGREEAHPVLLLHFAAVLLLVELLVLPPKPLPRLLHVDARHPFVLLLLLAGWRGLPLERGPLLHHLEGRQTQKKHEALVRALTRSQPGGEAQFGIVF